MTSFLKTSLDFMDKCYENKSFATDLEVINSRRSITCFSLAYSNNKAISIPLIDEQGYPFFTEKEEYQLWDKYGKLIEDPEVSICNQNLLFDLLIINECLGFIPAGKWQDTMIGFNVLYPNFPQGIDFISSIYSDEPYWKDDSGKVWLNKTLKLDNYKQFLEYNAKDAAVAYECWHGNNWNPGIEADLKAQGFWKTYELTMEPAEALLYMMKRGIKVNQEAIVTLDTEVTEELYQLKQELRSIIGKDFNPSSSVQCKKYFYETLKLKPYLNLKTKKPSTDDAALSKIARKGEKGSKEAKLLMKLRHLEKQKKSYLDCEWSKDGRMRCSWKIRGTIFGRFASSKTIYNEGLNFQNLDPEFAGFLVADEDI